MEIFVAGKITDQEQQQEQKEEGEEEEEEYTNILGSCCVREEFQKIPNYFLFTILQDHGPLSKD